MKLVQQKKLKFQDAKSDKVYEADLCDVGDGKYVVNFRYGRRGAVLKEGTKTSVPVDLEKAQKVFDKLVLSKTKKGYTDDLVASAPKVTLPEISAELGGREKAILSHLKLAVENPKAQAKKNWNIKRVMWRAGELKLKSAVPYLTQLHGTGDAMHSYSAIWALGRCGAGKEAAPILETYLGASYANNINQMATAALLDVLEGPAKTAFVEKLLGTVPPTFKDKINASATVFKGFLHEFIYSRSTKKFDFITTLYLVSSEYPNVRQAFAEIMKAVPFKPPYFKFVRAIFKIAEYRNDGQIFGTLAYRFEKQNPFFNRPSHSGGVWAAGGWVADVEKELKKANTKLAYSQRTQSYMNRRIWRWMNKLTAEQDENFVKIATGLLLSYSQEDYTRPQKDVRWKYNKQTRRYDKSTVHFDAFADSQLLNYILYANSSRYEYMKDRKKWKCINGFMPGMEAPKEREEACPKLWDKVPRAFVHLLVESEVDKVQEFALRAFQNHAEYKPLTTKIDANLIARFLEKSFRPTAIWGLDLAKKKYDPNNPNRKLTLSMVGSSLEEARTLGKQWIQNNYDFFFSNTDFILTMLMHKQEDIRKWIKEDLSKIISKLTTPQKQVLAGRIISHLLAYKAKKENNPIAREYADILTAYFPDLMKRIGLSVIRDLMKHKLEENQKFAGELILGHETRAEDLPVDLFEAFIRSQRPHHRAIGIELFGRFPDATLLGRQEELLKFATSALADVRGAVRPVILRLAKEHESFGLDCVNRFVPILLRKEKYEGLHTDMYGLLTSELNTYLSTIDRKLIFRLLNSEHTKAQELGTVLVDKYIPVESLSVPNMIRLANHEILGAREVAWRMFNDDVARVRYEREEALRLMDSDWDDTRAFAFTYFRDNYRDKEWTPELLISVCDSVRPDVSAFGRELITKFFKEEDGEQYLLKLTQHPTPELQLFATNYLERFASDDLEKIKKLEFFFVTVLSQVFRGRTAKDRVLNFLRAEAMKNKDVAEIVARILDRLSLTYAKGDKSTSIEMMRDIHSKYPNIEVPISLK